MFSNKNIIVTIGNYGAVVALHVGDELKNKIFLEDLNDSAKKDLKSLFVRNKSALTYVMLDTVDQSYKKKVYPPVKKNDLYRIINRDLASDGDQEGIKNYIILSKHTPSQKKQGNNRWECLFISSSNSEVINNWIAFLLEMPNRMVGIYMLPIEAFNLFKLLKSHIKSSSKIANKKNDLYCFVIQNKVSGIRQIVFSDQGIVFTRIVNYNFEQSDFLEKYEQDIYSTFEYLKRLFPNLSMSELDIINIFPAEVLTLIKTLQNIELNFINYTPFQIASEIGYPKMLSKKSSFCDLLISKVFSKEKKILKFSTPKISVLDKFFITLKASYYLNLVLVMMICAAFSLLIFSRDKTSNLILSTETERISVSQELNKIRDSTLKDQAVNSESGEIHQITEIMDLGKIEEVLGEVGINFMEFYINLKFLKNFNVKLNSFSYSINNFNSKAPVSNSSDYKISFAGDIINQSGNIDDLFREFDTLVTEVKKNLENNQVTYSELPRDIDFNQKYYSFPVVFTITKNSQ